MKRCVRCGNKISWEMPFCPLCGGRSLANEPDPEPARELTIRPTAPIVPQPPQQEPLPPAPPTPPTSSFVEKAEAPAKPSADDAAVRISSAPKPEPMRPETPAAEPEDISSEPVTMPLVESHRSETIKAPPAEETPRTLEEPLIEPRRQPVVIDLKPTDTPKDGVFERSRTPAMIRTSPARVDEIDSSSFVELKQPPKLSPPKEEDEATAPALEEQKAEDAPAEGQDKHKTRKPDIPIGEFLRMYPNASPGESEL